MNSFKKFKVGDRIQVKNIDTAYDKGGNILLTDIGTIKSFAPKVRIIKRLPLYDGLEYFAYCEFDRIVDEVHQNHLRGGIDICNLRRAEKNPAIPFEIFRQKVLGGLALVPVKQRPIMSKDELERWVRKEYERHHGKIKQ